MFRPWCWRAGRVCDSDLSALIVQGEGGKCREALQRHLLSGNSSCPHLPGKVLLWCRPPTCCGWGLRVWAPLCSFLLNPYLYSKWVFAVVIYSPTVLLTLSLPLVCFPSALTLNTVMAVWLQRRARDPDESKGKERGYDRMYSNMYITS